MAGVQCVACTVGPDITLYSTAAEVGDLARCARAMTGVQHRHVLASPWDAFPGTGSASEHDSFDSC